MCLHDPWAKKQTFILIKFSQDNFPTISIYHFFLWMLFSILTRTIMYNFNGNSMPWINKLMKIFFRIFFPFYVHELCVYFVMLNKQGKKNSISFGNFNSIIFYVILNTRYHLVSTLSFSNLFKQNYSNATTVP